MAAGSLEQLDISPSRELLNRYLDGDLSDAEQADVSRRLEAEPELRAELDGLENVVGALGALPFTFAPDDFVDRVQTRMRRQSAGRLFANNVLRHSRIPYEAIAVVMILVMAAAYLLLEPPIEVKVEDPGQATTKSH
jgi:anti-sigma factor RsiW